MPTVVAEAQAQVEVPVLVLEVVTEVPRKVRTRLRPLSRQIAT